ncbi:MAG: hypothetical protein PVG08_04640 [Desulfobacterales bacterium]|jgi:hypothetical protein
MSFKANLLKKIEIDNLAHKVINSIGPPDSGQKIDKDAMRRLLEMSAYTYQKERDLDLYVEKADEGQSKILVLDNELPIYKTTIEDVVMRKSPYIKEMANIRNIIKILKDSDVKISRKAESVIAVQKECIDPLDLSFDESDIEAIAKDGEASLDNDYADGIIESLTLFAELLGYKKPPKVFAVRHHQIFGALFEKDAGEVLYGPMVIVSLMDNSIQLIDEQISSLDKDKMQYYQQVVQGKEKASIKGSAVFKYLKKAVLANKLG